MALADESFARGEPSLTRLVPAVRLLAALGASLQFKKLYLAALGLLLLDVGWGLIDGLVPPGRNSVPLAARHLDDLEPDSVPVLGYVEEALWRLSEPPRVVLGPFVDVFSRGIDGRDWIRAALAGVWAAFVWGTIGGALARIATLEVARGEKLGLRAALWFALGKLVPLVGGPLTPLFGVALFAAFCALFGLLYRLPPVAGPTVAGVLLVLPLVAGLVMAIILLGVGAGWPLVHASVAAEAEDGFDALSRSYAYVYQRLGRYAAYIVAAWLIGVAGIVFVDLFALLVVHLATWGISLSAPRDLLPIHLGAGSHSARSAAVVAHAFWLAFVQLLVRGWSYAYFWTSASIIYLLLRRSVDGTDFHQVVPAAPARTPGDDPAAKAPASSVPE
jgi:hypothetical protein